MALLRRSSEHLWCVHYRSATSLLILEKTECYQVLDNLMYAQIEDRVYTFLPSMRSQYMGLQLPVTALRTDEPNRNAALSQNSQVLHSTPPQPQASALVVMCYRSLLTVLQVPCSGPCTCCVSDSPEVTGYTPGNPFINSFTSIHVSHILSAVGVPPGSAPLAPGTGRRVNVHVAEPARMAGPSTRFLNNDSSARGQTGLAAFTAMTYSWLNR